MNDLTIKEAAERCGITKRRLQQLCKEGSVKGAYKKGIKWFIPMKELPAAQLPATSGKLPLPVGISDYKEAVSGYYYVDKTLLIKELIDTRPKVLLFTRPRRFGKTLNMDMLRVFFEKTTEDTSGYFKDKAIWNCGERYQEYQGKYPVIFLTFKDVKFDSWQNAYQDIVDIIRLEYNRHAELAAGRNLSRFESEFYQKIMDGTADFNEMARSLGMLSAMLRKYHGEKVVLIVDEYDTPIQQGQIGTYYNEMISFMRNLFSVAFKDNENLAFGFLTGILRIAKESVFSGMNNLKVNTILDQRFSSCFGFTEQEVEEMLTYYGRKDKLSETKEWYDGYQFGSSEIYNPWSVINYVDEDCRPDAYWLTSGNDLIGEILRKAPVEILASLQDLMQGEQTVTIVNTGIVYPEIFRNPSYIYSFLLMTGYLRIVEIIPQNGGGYLCRTAIPNKEITTVYEQEILSHLMPAESVSTAALIRQAFYEHNIAMLTDQINNFLKQTISFYDSADEAFYHGMMIGLTAILNNRFHIRSNRESGKGRFDIQLMPKEKHLPGILMELKATRNPEELEKLAEDALQQIAEKEYVTEMEAQGIQPVYQYGIAFCGKETVIHCKHT